MNLKPHIECTRAHTDTTNRPQNKFVIHSDGLLPPFYALEPIHTEHTHTHTHHTPHTAFINNNKKHSNRYFLYNSFFWLLLYFSSVCARAFFFALFAHISANARAGYATNLHIFFAVKAPQRPFMRKSK